MNVKRKRVALNLEQKISIMSAIEIGKKQTTVAATFVIASLNRENIRWAHEESSAGTIKCLRRPTHW